MKVTTVNQNGRIIEMNFQAESPTEDIAYAMTKWLQELPVTPEKIEKPLIPPTPKRAKTVNKNDFREPHEIIQELQVIHNDIEEGLQDLESMIYPKEDLGGRATVTGTLTNATPMTQDEIEAIEESYGGKQAFEDILDDVPEETEFFKNEGLNLDVDFEEGNKEPEPKTKMDLARKISLIEKNCGMVVIGTDLVHPEWDVKLPINGIENMNDDEFESIVKTTLDMIAKRKLAATEKPKAEKPVPKIEPKVTTSNPELQAKDLLNQQLKSKGLPYENRRGKVVTPEGYVAPQPEVTAEPAQLSIVKDETPSMQPLMEEVSFEAPKEELSLVELFERMKANALAKGLDPSQIPFTGQTAESIAKWEEYVENYNSPS